MTARNSSASISLWTASSERKATPRPRLTVSLMAALLPSSSVIFSPASDIPARSKLFSKAAREPDPGSRMMSDSPVRDLSGMRFRCRPAMPRCNDKHEGIAADRAKFKARFLDFLPDQAERRSALFDILHDRSAIAHRGPDVDAGICFMESRQQGREEAFAGDGTGSNRQIARNGRPEPADVYPGQPVQVEDLPRIAIEPLPGIAEGNPPGPAIEQRDAKLFFEHRDSLAHGRLCDAQVGPRRR